MKNRFLRLGMLPLLLSSLVLLPDMSSRAPIVNRYRMQSLVSDGSLLADHFDSHLVNAWGIARGPTGPWWVANGGTGTVTVYDKKGNTYHDWQGNPPAIVLDVGGEPTGIVSNEGSSFIVKDGNDVGPARFIIANIDGKISAWSPGVPAPTPSTEAFTMIDLSAQGAVFTGLAIGGTSAGLRLFAADFGRGLVRVFDGEWNDVTPRNLFADPSIPSGFAPFGIQSLNGRLFVSYAKVGDEGDEEAGAGFGYVNVFTPDGSLIARVASRGALNAPWGMALAPAGFGAFSGQLLIGNFGDGRISAYDMDTFEFKGQLADTNGEPLEIEGLWGIAFGNGALAGSAKSLYFAAGPKDEEAGIFGLITASPAN